MRNIIETAKIVIGSILSIAGYLAFLAFLQSYIAEVSVFIGFFAFWGYFIFVKIPEDGKVQKQERRKPWYSIYIVSESDYVRRKDGEVAKFTSKPNAEKEIHYLQTDNLTSNHKSDRSDYIAKIHPEESSHQSKQV